MPLRNRWLLVTDTAVIYFSTQRNQIVIPGVYGVMRFMAVFIQLDTCYALGFEDSDDATDFLFWGYEEYDLVPCGMYDMLTGEITEYEHRGRSVGLFDPDLIRKTATEYVRAALRLKGRSSRQTDSPPGRVI